MTSYKKLISLVLLIALLLVVVGCGNKNHAQVGQMAPDFTLTTLSDHEVTLSKLHGQKLFLNFWASWCVPCTTEMPDLQAMSRKYDKQITVYGVNMTSEDGIGKANEFVVNHSLTFPILIDEDGKVKKDYYISGIPVSITIDETGKIIDRHEGQLTHDQMQQMFERLLNEKPATDTKAEKKS
ncbi:MAG: TlpA family protein disulfide reductase [Tumebacillaceae bacterium]